MAIVYNFDDELKPFGKRERLTVCEHCLWAIESREGKQFHRERDVDPDDEEMSKCDWCEESGFTTLNEIL